MARTKMIFTLGPASDAPGMMKALIEAGMDCARLNFSHGDHAEHARRLQRLRAVSKRLNQPVASLLDLTGPKLRVGHFEQGHIALKPKEEILLTPRAVVGKPGLIPISYAHLAKDVNAGDVILLDDGLLQVKVLRTVGQDIHAKVQVGGDLKDHKGLNLPGVALSIPALTSKDLDDLHFGLKLGVDLVALSFVRAAKEIVKLKKIIAQQGSRALVIAKIEKPEAIPALEEIIQAADGVMVARGDLGVEMHLEKVPTLQKKIITLANRYGRVVITATQMLQTMMDNPTPTRAEASDVANAIFDGTDAVMLSGETAAGHYPKQAARMMERILIEAEQAPQYNRLTAAVDLDTPEDAVVASAVELAEKVHAHAMVIFTTSGYTAKLVSRQRPQVPVLVLAHDAMVQRQLSLWWGLDCLLSRKQPALEAVVKAAEKLLLQKKRIKAGQTIVIVTSSLGDTKPNFIKVHTVG